MKWKKCPTLPEVTLHRPSLVLNNLKMTHILTKLFPILFHIMVKDLKISNQIIQLSLFVDAKPSAFQV